MPDTVNTRRIPMRRKLLLGTLILVTALLGGWLYIAKMQRDMNRKLLGAVRKGDVSTVKLLLANGANPNIRDMPQEQLTLWQQIRYAFHADSPASQHTNPNVRVHPGFGEFYLTRKAPTVLEMALEPLSLRFGDMEEVPNRKNALMVKALLDAGARTEDSTYNHTTPLMKAVARGDFQSTQILLMHGADPVARDDEGQIPLYYIDTTNECSIAEMLVHWGNDVNSVDEQGRTPLMASLSSDIKTVRFVIGQGANVNIRAVDGSTALLIAARAGDIEVVKLLIGHGAVVNVYDAEKQTPLFRAAKSDSPPVVKLLLERGAEVNVCDNSHDSPLHSAIEAESIPVISMLIAHGAKIDPVNKNGDTPLTDCLNCGDNPEIVTLLIKHRANVDHRNKSGETALSLATKHSYQETLLLLRDAGAKQ